MLARPLLLGPVLLLAALLPAATAGGSARAVYDPWLQKPVLGYLYSDDPALNAARQDLAQTVGVTGSQRHALASIAARERQSLGQVSGANPTIAEVQRQNARVLRAVQVTDRQVHQTLGPKYPAFRAWLRTWWNRHHR
jgi:hypothetical protein